MKKTIMIPLALLACASLLIGCGGKKEDKKPNPESESSEPEPGPGPEPEPEEIVVFPKTLEEAGFVDMGDLSLEYPREFEEAMSDRIDVEELEFSHLKAITIYGENSPTYNYKDVEEHVDEFQVYENDIVEFVSGEKDYDLYENFGKVDTYFQEETELYIAEGDEVYYKDEYKSEGGYLWHRWSTSDVSLEYIIEDTYENYVSYATFYSQPAITKIGNYYYLVGYTMDREIDSTTTAYGETIEYCLQMKQETIVRINSDFNVDELYMYQEVTIDHNPINGEFYDEPFIVYFAMSNVEFDYGNYPTYQNVPEIPDQYFYSASVSFKLAPVTLGNSGEILTQPEFPTDWNSLSDEFFIDYETAALMFTPYSNSGQFIAIEFGFIAIGYEVLTGEDVGTINTVQISLDDEDIIASMAEIMGAQLLEFNEETYFVIDQESVEYLEFDFSAFGVETLSDISVRKLSTDFYLR